ncbi:MAG: class I SAM-dependent methyltransferase [bacterium]|nr:class I SAM-dependent methyltransferase [bacterium]
MATIEENRTLWTGYDWSQSGEEWSQVWGGSEYLWWGAVYPRILNFLPVAVGLEIAPGFGRMTEFLQDFCDQLVAVDLARCCIRACEERFRHVSHITFRVNDGKSLEMIRDHTIDFAFSFDSLVHADDDAIRGYLQALGRKLSPTGVGFIHHSNLAACLDPATGKPPAEAVPHWRSESMSAQRFREYCEEAGLECTGQEIINWGGSTLLDCFSTFTRPGSPYSRPCRIWENPGFMAETATLNAVAAHYRTPGPRRG